MVLVPFSVSGTKIFVSRYASSVVVSGIGGFLVVGDQIISAVVSFSMLGLRIKKTKHDLLSIQFD